ncbi:1,2-dihydroxy-3-keto-5-methylthiopentene dioxygenase [Amycolatopsis sp. lyj-109]|uniref:1,2-dihydroxy-3-keto-5-methylthiopentene dioxygenase n=1 Tax=Amycolatopsis sp. lyj-109 TaxID=2789287 RepID=UPI00397AF572
MTLLTVWPDDRPDEVTLRSEDAAEIADVLKPLDVRFERWDVAADLPEAATQEEILAAYRPQIDRIAASEGYQVVDAVRMTPSDDPEWVAEAAAARQKFLAEHTHDDDEDRFFARGAGVFYLHVGASVYAVLCEAGDLLSVPANTTHWFDMGTRPDYVSIRFFHDDGGWVGNFTGATLSSDFPDFDTLAAGR